MKYLYASPVDIKRVKLTKHIFFAYNFLVRNLREFGENILALFMIAIYRLNTDTLKFVSKLLTPFNVFFVTKGVRSPNRTTLLQTLRLGFGGLVHPPAGGNVFT